jgi:hypothetical protein
MTEAQARTGYSWTTDRNVACWFAMRFAGQRGSPLVLSTDIAKTVITLFTNERAESEAVLMRSPMTALIDGDMRDWTLGQARLAVAHGGDLRFGEYYRWHRGQIDCTINVVQL